MTIKSINNRGRKGVIGHIDADVKGLNFFAGYTDCDECGNRGKVLLNTQDVRILSRKLGYELKPRIPIGARVTKRLARHYNI